MVYAHTHTQANEGGSTARTHTHTYGPLEP